MPQFTSEDLIQNRSGQISSSQRKTLEVTFEEGQKKTQKIMSGVIVVCVIGVGYKLLQKGDFGLNTLLILAGVGVGLAVYYFGIKQYSKYQADKILSGIIQLESLTGQVKVTTKNVNSRQLSAVQNFVDEDITTSYTFKIGDKTFYSDEHILSLLEDGQNYRVYFVEFTKKYPMPIAVEKI